MRALKILTGVGLVAFLLVILVPFWWIASMSFKTYEQIQFATSIYVPKPFTWENYTGLWSETRFPLWLRNSLVTALVVTATTTVIIALTWRWMFDAFPGRGFFNSVLLDVGLSSRPIAFMATPEGAMAAVIVANWWRAFPFFGVSFLAGMASIPRELYEAASVDGAGAARRFWHITLPGLKHVITVTTLLSFILTINDFNIIYVMTRGGPGTATQIFATMAYDVALVAGRIGEGSAISLFLFPALLVVIVLMLKYLRRE